MGTKISVPHSVTQSSRKKSLQPKCVDPEPTPAASYISTSTLDPFFMCFNPHREDAADRMTSNHFALNALFEGNILPIIEKNIDFNSSTTRILDIGCGPGSWVMDMATHYPNAQFVGIDQYPLFPSDIRPANVEFKQADVFLGLPFENNSFDFIQIRFFSLVFNRTQWTEALDEANRLLKPGGYVQLLEPRLIGEGNSLVKGYAQEIKSILEFNDFDSQVCDHLPQMLEKSNLIPKELVEKSVPLENHVLSGEFLYLIDINLSACKQFIMEINTFQTDEDYQRFKTEFLASIKQNKAVFKAVAGQKPT